MTEVSAAVLAAAAFPAHSAPLAGGVALPPGTVPFANASGALAGDSNFTYPTGGSVNIRGLVRGQGALSTNPSGGSPPLWWWASGSAIDANDFGHGDKTLFEMLDTNSAPTSGPMMRFVRQHTGAVGGTDLLHTTVLNITTYSPGSSNGNNETSAIYLGPSGAANGLTIYKSNQFNPVGATDYSTFGSKGAEIATADAGDAMELTAGFGGNTAYQSQALTVSMGGSAFYPNGVKGIVVQPGGGGFDDRAAFECASHALNAQNTSQRFQVTLSGKLFATQGAVIGAGQTTGAIDMTGNLGGALLLNDSGTGGGNGGMVLFGSKGSFASRTAFAAIKGYGTDGSNNTVGDLIFSTRAASTDATMTERFRLTAAGVVAASGTTAGWTVQPTVTPGASVGDGVVLGGGVIATGSTNPGAYSSVHIKGSTKTGTGVIPQAYTLQVDAPGVAATSAITALFNGQVNISGLALVASLAFQTDAVNDLGFASAFRPRDIFAARNIIAAGSLRTQHVAGATPSGGASGDIVVGAGKIWVNDAGTWKSTAVA